MKRLRPKDCAGGFSLVELLVVMAIIGLLAALLLPAFEQARRRAGRVTCLSNLRQIGLAFHAFAHDHENRFPMEVPASAGGSREFADVAKFSPAEFDLACRHFRPLARELVTPALLICPADTRRPAAAFATLQSTNLSYFVALRARFGSAVSILAGDRNLTNDWLGPASSYRLDANSMVRWTHELHRFKGNLLFGDGHAEQWNSLTLFVTAANNVASGEVLLPAANATNAWSAPRTRPARAQVLQPPGPPTSGAKLVASAGSATVKEPPAAAPKPTAALKPSPLGSAATSVAPPPASPANPLEFLVGMVSDIVTGFYWLLLLLLALLVAWRSWFWLRQRHERARQFGGSNPPDS